MSDLDQELAAMLHARAHHVNIVDRADEIVSTTGSSTSPPRGNHRTKRWLLTAACLALVATAIVLVAGRGRDEPTPAGPTDTLLERSTASPTTDVQSTDAPTVGVSSTGVTTRADDEPDPPQVDGWTALPAMPVPARFAHAAVATDDGIFVWGGYGDTDDGEHNVTELDDGAYYRDATGEWESVTGAPLDIAGQPLATWTGNEVIVIDGERPTAAAFDPATTSWRPIAAPPVEVASSGVGRLLPIDTSHVAYVHLEYRDALGNGVRIVMYDVETDTWDVIEPARDALSYGVAVPDVPIDAAVSGDLLAILSTSSPCAPQLDVYALPSGEWLSDDAIPLPHADGEWNAHSLQGLGAGRFLAVGTACDRYDETWGALAQPLDGTTSTTETLDLPVYEAYRSANAPGIDMYTSLGPEGRPVLYRPDLDQWAVGAPLSDGVTVYDAPLVTRRGPEVVMPGYGAVVGDMCCVPSGDVWSQNFDLDAPTNPGS